MQDLVLHGDSDVLDFVSKDEMQRVGWCVGQNSSLENTVSGAQSGLSPAEMGGEGWG